MKNNDYIDSFEYFMSSDKWELLLKMPSNVWINDLKNERNGKLTARLPFKNNDIKDKSIYWLCECDCGNFIMLRGNRFKKINSCGCDKKENYIGQRNNHLICKGQKISKIKDGNQVFRLEVECDCGKTIYISPQRFLNSKCCGRNCPYILPDETKKQNGQRFKDYFFKDTNISKIGRKEPNRNSKTGYLGVFYVPSTNKYSAIITFQGKTENLGTYNTPELAYQVRLSAQNMLQTKFLKDLQEDEFIKNNQHLKKLLIKVKSKLGENDDKN